jgi:hypothetical protein
MRAPVCLALCALAFAAGTEGCASSDGAAEDGGSEINEGSGPKLCAAVRGNGQSIVTHFASLSRIVEHYGVIDGMAGGSSGSITTFIYESILKNPAITTCGGATCSEADRSARVALALKSVQGYGATVVGSEEGVAIRELVAVGARIKKSVEDSGILGLVSTDIVLAAKRLVEVLSIPEVRTLVNPEVFTMLTDVAHLRYNVNEILTSIKTLGAFSVDDNRLFFRTGILNWDALALLFGRVADFYAGFEPADAKGLGSWLDTCATRTVGKPWDEAATVPAPTGGTCGDTFQKLVSDYRTKVRANDIPSKRLNDRIGDPASPLHKLVTTAVLEGNAIDAWKAGRAEYLAAKHETGNIPFNINFGDVKIGYWGSQADLTTVAQHKAPDLKSQKMTSLGNGTWKEALTASPAEPGLSHFVQLPDGRLSGGGWSDLAPVVALKSMGCDKVIYVTRIGDESGFAAKIAKQLGMDEAGWKALYDLDTPTSSYNASLEQADAVWCTNWNAFEDLQQREMSLDAWHAPLEEHAGFASLAPLRPYDNVTERTGKPGCTPHVSGGAKFPQD